MPRPRIVERGPAYWLDQQRKMMEERGGNASGYVAFYTQYGRPEDEAVAIYDADRATRLSLERAAKRGRW